MHPKAVTKSWAELNKDELYQLLQLRNKVFVVEQECVYQDLDGKDVDALHYLMYSDVSGGNPSEIMAYCRSFEGKVDNKSYQVIGRVCTDKKYRGQGISRQLMTRAIEYNQQQSDLPLTVSAQAYLEAFYRSLGFETISEPYLEDGIPHIRMVRET